MEGLDSDGPLCSGRSCRDTAEFWHHVIGRGVVSNRWAATSPVLRAQAIVELNRLGPMHAQMPVQGCFDGGASLTVLVP